jgi:tRNA U34 2-thiouridine synthase MnmA/TrmU
VAAGRDVGTGATHAFALAQQLHFGGNVSSQSAVLYDGEVCLGGGVIGAARGKGLAD